MLAAYRGWEESRQEGGRSGERDYLRRNFLSMQTLNHIQKMATQFKQLLRDVGFYARSQHSAYNENSDNLQLVRAVLVAGLYPNVVKIQRPAAAKGKKGGGKPQPPKLTTRKLWDRRSSKDESVALHPSSVLYGRTSFPHVRPRPASGASAADAAASCRISSSSTRR